MRADNGLDRRASCPISDAVGKSGVAMRPGQYVRTRPQYDDFAGAEDAAGVQLLAPFAADQEACLRERRPGVYNSRVLRSERRTPATS